MKAEDAEIVKTRLQTIHKEWMIANGLLTDEMLHDAKFDVMKDALHLQLVAQMGKALASNSYHLDSTIVLERVPASGWDYLKRMLRMKYRERSVTMETKIIHMCPHVHMERAQAHFAFLANPGAAWRFGKEGGDEG